MFFVKFPNGQEYGPADKETILQWAREERVTRDALIREDGTGNTWKAGDILPADVFPAAQPAVAPQVVPTQPNQYQNPYPRANPYPAHQVQEDKFPWGAVGYSLAGIASFFLIGGLGFIFAAYAIAAAVNVKKSGSKYGIMALVVSIVAAVLIGVGWIVRLSPK